MRRAEVIGDPIAQSKSPVIHRFWLDALGMEGDYRATLVPVDALGDWFATRRGDPDWAGANVTMPLKAAVIPYLDRLSDGARRLGAVNCIVPGVDGLLSGHNTDVDGVAEPLRRHTRPDDANPVAACVQIIGAGGAARAAAAGAALAGYGEFDFFNRTQARAVEMAQWWGLPEYYGHSLEALGPIRTAHDGPGEQRDRHVIINASPMGMLGNPPVPVVLAHYGRDTLVFDMVYAPLETPLLADARRRGLRTIDGLEMLVGQAAVAFEHFFGRTPPRDRDAELRALLLSQ